MFAAAVSDQGRSKPTSGRPPPIRDARCNELIDRHRGVTALVRGGRDSYSVWNKAQS